MVPRTPPPKDFLLQPSSLEAPTFFDRLRSEAGRRSLAIGLALIIEALMILMMLSLSADRQPDKEDSDAIVVTIAQEDETPTKSAPPEQTESSPTTPVPRPTATQPPDSPSPIAPAPVPPPPIILPSDFHLPPAPPRPTPGPARPAPARPVYGPQDTARPLFPDSQRVGTAPNGEPLYAAAWYREPSDAMLSDYLSTANGSGWGLIACRTAPDYRVEDCVGLAEYPEGSQIVRAVLAAAWEFKVRPPRRGGQALVGSWVRIRIDYQRN